jgi:hypothetical protein
METEKPQPALKRTGAMFEGRRFSYTLAGCVRRGEATSVAKMSPDGINHGKNAAR